MSRSTHAGDCGDNHIQVMFYLLNSVAFVFEKMRVCQFSSITIIIPQPLLDHTPRGVCFLICNRFNFNHWFYFTFYNIRSVVQADEFSLILCKFHVLQMIEIFHQYTEICSSLFYLPGLISKYLHLF